jgi:hypothetical protein
MLDIKQPNTLKLGKVNNNLVDTKKYTFVVSLKARTGNSTSAALIMPQVYWPSLIDISNWTVASALVGNTEQGDEYDFQSE